jgi:YegS/Rv2252/BmrU family lipid kinase
MTEADSVAVVNPASAGGKTATTWERVQKILGNVRALKTAARGHAIELTTAALKSGARTIIAVGGDGTINEVVNGFFSDGRLINADAVLGIVPAGTSSDLRRSLDLPVDPKEAAFILRNGVPRAIDVMRVRYTSSTGATATRYAINVTSFGISGLVAALAPRAAKRVGGRLGYLGAAAIAAIRFPGRRVVLTLDGANRIEERITNVAVGNGRYHGAGMHVCPNADLTDGLLDVTVIGYVSLFELLANARLLYNGRILDHPKVQAFRARHVKAESTEPTLVEIDGEPLGQLPIEIELLPKALQVLR